MKWIKASEQLPEKNQRILVYIYDEPIRIYIYEEYTGEYNSTKTYFSDCCHDSSFGEEHFKNIYWMPLPKKPE